MKAREVLSLTRHPTGVLIAALVVNGRSARFMVDSGASHTCVDRVFATREKFVHSERTGAAYTYQLFGEAAPVVNDSCLRIGTIEIAEWPIPVVDLTFMNTAFTGAGGEAIDGVLGADFLHACEAVLDFAEATLAFQAPDEDESSHSTGSDGTT